MDYVMAWQFQDEVLSGMTCVHSTLLSFCHVLWEEYASRLLLVRKWEDIWKRSEHNPQPLKLDSTKHNQVQHWPCQLQTYEWENDVLLVVSHWISRMVCYATLFSNNWLIHLTTFPVLNPNYSYLSLYYTHTHTILLESGHHDMRSPIHMVRPYRRKVRHSGQLSTQLTAPSVSYVMSYLEFPGPDLPFNNFSLPKITRWSEITL